MSASYAHLDLEPEQRTAEALYAKGRTLSEIGRGFGVSYWTVRNWLRERGVKLRRDPGGRRK